MRGDLGISVLALQQYFPILPEECVSTNLLLQRIVVLSIQFVNLSTKLGILDTLLYILVRPRVGKRHEPSVVFLRAGQLHYLALHILVKVLSFRRRAEILSSRDRSAS